MDISREPTQEEINELADNMMRVYLYHDSNVPCREDRDYTNKKEALDCLKDSVIVITELKNEKKEKAGVIFWGGNHSSFPSIIHQYNGKLCLAYKGYTGMFWGINEE